MRTLLNGVPRGGGGIWVVQPHPPKFRKSSKIVPNSTRLWKLLKIAEFRWQTPQDVRKKGSKILKLPTVWNCFTLAMTNKLVVIINSLKIPKIKNILLYEMKFLVPNYSCLQNPWLGGYHPQIPVLSVLCPQLKLLKGPPPNKIPRCATSTLYTRTTKQAAQIAPKQLHSPHAPSVTHDQCQHAILTAINPIRTLYCPNDHSTTLQSHTVW